MPETNVDNQGNPVLLAFVFLWPLMAVVTVESMVVPAAWFGRALTATIAAGTLAFSAWCLPRWRRTKNRLTHLDCHA